jgi:hypothetical protein
MLSKAYFSAIIAFKLRYMEAIFEQKKNPNQFVMLSMSSYLWLFLKHLQIGF